MSSLQTVWEWCSLQQWLSSYFPYSPEAALRKQKSKSTVNVVFSSQRTSKDNGTDNMMKE